MATTDTRSPDPAVEGPLTPAAAATDSAAEREAARLAADLRETAGRVAAATGEVQDRWHETEGLIARVEGAEATGRRSLHDLESGLSAAHDVARAHQVHTDHGNRLLGTKGPDHTLHDPPTTSADAASDPAAPSRKDV